jgi:predicted nuclease of predicted toxin-antitoxin system
VKILLDECIPRTLKRYLTGHHVQTAQQAGFGGYKNGRLLRAAEGEFDLLITSDKNLQYQQNLASRKMSILILSTNHRPSIEENRKEILRTVNRMKPQQFFELDIR